MRWNEPRCIHCGETEFEAYNSAMCWLSMGGRGNSPMEYCKGFDQKHEFARGPKEARRDGPSVPEGGPR